MATPYQWWRRRVGRDYSFPLKRSDLDAALARSAAVPLHAVTLWPAAASAGDLLVGAAKWTGVDGRPPGPPPHTASLTFYAVPRARRAEITRLVAEEALPRLLTWMRDIDRGPETRRSE